MMKTVNPYSPLDSLPFCLKLFCSQSQIPISCYPSEFSFLHIARITEDKIRGSSEYPFTIIVELSYQLNSSELTSFID